jgi:hypothetical protein
MENRYFCEICRTNPDQLSHHKSHLQTQKHKKKCEEFIKEMKIFSLAFREVNHNKWYESEYKDFIISKYKETTKNTEIDNEKISKWIFSIVLGWGNGRYGWDPNCFNGKSPVECYRVENNLDKEFEIKTADKIAGKNTHYINWAINKILKQKETKTTQPKSIFINKIKENNYFKFMLSKHANIKINKIRDVRNGLIDIEYLFKPIHHIDFSEHDIELYSNIPVNYSCLLFDKFGIHCYNSMYNGLCGPIDIEECPEEKKYNSFYFYKEVNIEHTSKIENVVNYGENRIERRNIWLSCYMGDFIDYFDYLEDKTKECYMNDVPTLNYSYISNDDFKYFIKESLIEIFTNRIKMMEKYIEVENDRKIICEWSNKDEMISYDCKSNNYYFVTKKFMDDDYNNPKMYILDIKKDKKLTEEQTIEYVKFLDKKATNIEKLNEELKYCETELLKIKDLSLTSEIINSVVYICQYLFEYNEDLIEYYKNNQYIGVLNIQKEKMQRAILEKEFGFELEDLI